MAAPFGSRVSNVRGRRSFRKRRESEDENIYLDMNRDPFELMQEILYHIVKSDVSKKFKLSYLNSLVRFCQKTECYQNMGYSLSDIFCCLRVSFFHEASEIRAAILRACRYLLQDVAATEAFCCMKLHYLVARSVDVLLDNRLERIHAVRLMRKFLCINPVGFPSAFTHCLIAVVNEGVQERELLRACLATLAQLALLNYEAFSSSYGISALLRNAIDCQQPKITEAILGVLLYLYNDPNKRQFVGSDLGLQHLLAPFTDCHYRYPSEIIDGSINDDRDNKLSATKLAVVAVLRSWSGIAYFSRTEQPELPSLVQMLHLPYPDMRKNIIELLFEVFNFSLPEWTDQYSVAILASDPSAVQTSWQLYEGFVVAEGNCVLPYTSKDRTNLLENYFALLLLLFVQAGIIEALVEVIITSTVHLSVLATILLGELLHMCNRLLPSDCCQQCSSLPSLISAAAAFRTPQEQKQASAAISCLYRIHEIKKHGAVPSSVILDNLLHSCNPDSKRPHFFGGAVSKAKLQYYVKKDMSDTISQALKDTLIFTKEYLSWDWHLIDNILKNPADSLKKLEEGSHRSFIQRLMQFFLPSSSQFSTIELENDLAQPIIVAGYHFMEFLLEMDEAKSHDYLEDFLNEVNTCIVEVTKDNVPQQAIFSPSKLMSTLSYAYFMLIGKCSCSNKGCKLLDKSGTFQNLLQLVCTTNINSYIKLVVSVLDYSKPGFSRTVLSKVLNGTSEHSRLYATNFLRVLLRAKLIDFRKWAIEFLVAQLHDPSLIVSSAALDILDEACNITENLETLASLRPSLLHLGDKGLLLLLRFLSLPTGFRFLRDSNFLYYEMERWKKFYNMKYVKIVEDMLNEALTRHKKSEDGNYGRRSSNTRHTVHDVYLPHHMYGQLVQHTEGVDVLINENCLSELCTVICEPNFSSELHLLKLKAALWAMGHIGSYTLGFSLVLKEGILPQITSLAANAPVLSIRGTCFFVLGLLSATSEGAALLNEAGWETIRRNHVDKWPIIEADANDGSYLSAYRSYSYNNDWPIGDLPYLSFVIQTSKQNISASHSSQSLDIEERKQSVSSSFSSTTSVQLPGNKVECIMRPRSSSDCQPNWKDAQFKKREVSSWDSLNNNEAVFESNSGIIFKERSISSYDMESHSEVSEDSCHTGTSVSNSCENDCIFPARSHSSEHVQTCTSTSPDCTSLCSSKFCSKNCKYSTLSKQLARGHSCYLQALPSPDDSTFLSFASLKDAQGYAALKNIQRRRVQSLCFQDHNSYVIDEDIFNTKMPTCEPVSLQKADEGIVSSKSNNSLLSCISNQVPENLDKQDATSCSSKENDARFIGLCLPSHFDLLFSIPRCDKDIMFDEIQVECDNMGLQLHSIFNCLASPSSHSKTGLLRTTIDEEAEETSNIECVEPIADVKEIPKQYPQQVIYQNIKTQDKLSEDSSKKALLRKEIMRCVTNLSSSIAVKSSEQGLLNIKQKFPDIFQDICLYSEICLHMAKYNFRLPARRFLQELFLDVTFVEIQWEAESISSISTLPQIGSSES